jgi:sigma-B regulation protein RsbU (phosphoserine phosphatase)
MKTLIVDDDAEMRLLLIAILRSRGHDVTACMDAETAWELYQREVYPLVVLDWLLPGMDGIQLCRQMRALPHGDRSVILMITGRDGAEDLQAVLEAGADDYLAKPPNIDLLEVRLTVAERQVETLSQRKQVEAALATARDQEVAIGARIQQTLLQGKPPTDLLGVEIAARTLASQKIDGDFYDFFRYHTPSLDVLIGDVMGKGIPAALIGAATKSQFLRALNTLVTAAAAGTLPTPAQIVTHVHAEVTTELIALESFVTVCYARFNLAEQRLDFVDCGHPKIIHCQVRSRACQTLQGNSMPLGFSATERYEQVSISFEAGDTFVFYSDGMTEARASNGEMFGEERLLACVRAYSALGGQDLLDRLCAQVHAFARSEQIADDLTCVVVKITPSDRAQPLTRAHLTISSDMAELERLRAFVRQVYQDAPWLPVAHQSPWPLELAVNEAASNIMRHAYHGRADQRIEVRAEVFIDRLSFCLQHWGDTFHPEAVPLPGLDGLHEGGMGLYIISQLVDNVRYTCDPKGSNAVLLVKKFS